MTARAISAALVCALAGAAHAGDPAAEQPAEPPSGQAAEPADQTEAAQPDRPAAEPRPLRWYVQAGGHAAVTGPSDYGVDAAIEVSPGGWFGRFGAGLRWRGFEGLDAGWLAGGWVYEAAAARPRLVITLHGEAGATHGLDQTYPVLGGGATSRLWLAGPLFLGTDGSAHLVWDGVDSRLALSFSLVLGLGR